MLWKYRDILKSRRRPSEPDSNTLTLTTEAQEIRSFVLLNFFKYVFKSV